MSSRRGTVYEERDFYEDRRSSAPAPVRTRERDFEEIDIYSSRREREPDRRPDFLREDYGRVDAGQVVLRERETETFQRPLERRPRSPSQVRLRERLVQREPSPAPVSEAIRSRTRIVERERRSPSPPPERLRARVVETRERIRERTPSPPPVRIRERSRTRIIEREKSPSPPPVVDRIRVRNFERETRQPTPSPSPSPSPPPAIRAPPIHQEIITHHRHIDHGFERARVPTPPPPARRSEPRTKETDIDIYTSRNNTEVDITRKETTREVPRERERRREVYDDSYIYEQERDRLRVSDREIEIRRSASARPERQIERQRERDFSLNIRDDDEADYYARKVDERAYIGEAYNGATKDWAIVDVPPGTERVQMDGVGGASQEITWQKYNGVRRSKFIPEREREKIEIREDSRRGEIIDRERIEIRDERPRDTTIERDRIEIRDLNEPRSRETGLEIEISRSKDNRRQSGVYERYEERVEEVTDRRVGLPRERKREGDLWTEITKDLVVREAIEQMGYDFEETEYFYYIIQYLRYEDVLQLVEISEEIKRERQRRIREIERERERLERRERDREEWERRERRRERDSFTDERILEREVIYDSAPPRRRW